MFNMHPGEYLKVSYLEPLDLSVAKLASLLEVDPDYIDDLIDAEADIDEEMAVRLENVLGRSAESWMVLQSSYAIKKARETEGIADLQPLRNDGVQTTLTGHMCCDKVKDGVVVKRSNKTNNTGAYVRYDLTNFDTGSNREAELKGYVSSFSRMPLIFQNGNPDTHGNNGITLESLLVVVEDRLQGFQQGDYACEENAEALHHTSKALRALLKRNCS